jgi:replication factor A1
VSDWNQKSLGFNNSSSFELNPAIDETARLQTWWEGGGSGSVTSLSQSTRGGGAGTIDSSRSTISDVKGTTLVAGEMHHANVRCAISRINPAGKGAEARPIWYASCVKCSKKVVGADDSGWSCESCGWSGAKCAYRYIMQMVVMDSTGSAFASLFNDQATALLGKTADDLKELKETDEQLYDDVLSKATFKRMVMRIRAKMDTYQDVSRQKLQVLSVAPINYATEARALLKEIELYGPFDTEMPQAEA